MPTEELIASIEKIIIHRMASPIGVLGPGNRAVIWVQGCPFTCAGCISPDSRDMANGIDYSINDIAEWVLNQPGIDGITISGGEPMMQAEAITKLINLIHKKNDIGVVCYTGYVYEDLCIKGNKYQLELLQRIDLLIDGPYIESKHADLLWRGSDNQRLIALTNRYAKDNAAFWSQNDHSAGIQVFISEEGVPWYAGVPPIPGFQQSFEDKMKVQGVNLIKEVYENER